MSREIFTPPPFIETERLIIRHFSSANEARACYDIVRNDPVALDPTQFYIRDDEDITDQEKLGYYKHSYSMFKDYGVFLRETGSFIGVVTMTLQTFQPKLGTVGILSDHARGILQEYQGFGFGGEVVTGIINHLLPKVGQYVIVGAEDLDSDSDDSEEESDSQDSDEKNESNDDNEINNTDLPTNQYQYLGHVTTVDFTNFPSIFSNLKAGMGINMIREYGSWSCREELLVLNYPPEESDLNTELMKNMFKALSNYEKSKTPELKNLAKDTIIGTILSINEPQTILFLGHYLAKEFGVEVTSTPELKEQLRKAFTYINEHQYSPFNEDGTFNLYYGNKIYYEFNDSIYIEVMGSQDSAPAGVDFTDSFNQLDLG